ncbi:peptidyl-prolyl cis-trans isomerase, cyclophilin-type family protein [Cryptosporidium muris RN66]|uniref:Peptidyl-prolyl cis-trans isomerase n=1 Tax=Cryptosporidium muris (strain RN66) TaxID=441375 RepID=B6AB76_CRYMR|nr:peptidyl-prolyl cis-trans isomerase, cyclophilin-type family protein [Cryptosporidium muris RN66]EEA05628.1 peptidyl-prolyl cis-trans isomerase, cyclophilin-type family protein [Cryptosporidium muris RN66]|eukprot:XP_002139977.1 peptidyl-prolyl cis-trans isomerase, cyclophilin-type family protein [Cryptosporidium muris RN66]
MSVLVSTSLGDIVIDLYIKECPKASENFLKLCKIKYYNNSLIHSVEKNFLIRTGISEEYGNTSIFGILKVLDFLNFETCKDDDSKVASVDAETTGYKEDFTENHFIPKKEQSPELYNRILNYSNRNIKSSRNNILDCISPRFKFFKDEICPKLRHNKVGLIGMANNKPNENGSEFYITLSENLDYLDEKHTIFGMIEEGLDVVQKINETLTDNDNSPLKKLYILHTSILDDPFPDPYNLHHFIPSESPPEITHIYDNEPRDNLEEHDELRLINTINERQARSRAITLEILGDIPDADIKPPENVLFICKLNPTTTEEDLELIFSRFGRILSCNIVYDWKTGESLQYAFIEFERKQDCELALTKMQGVIIDDRRIHVDFCQSVSKQWYEYRGRKKRGRLNELKNKNTYRSTHKKTLINIK